MLVRRCRIADLARDLLGRAEVLHICWPKVAPRKVCRARLASVKLLARGALALKNGIVHPAKLTATLSQLPFAYPAALGAACPVALLQQAVDKIGRPPHPEVGHGLHEVLPPSDLASAARPTHLHQVLLDASVARLAPQPPELFVHVVGRDLPAQKAHEDGRPRRRALVEQCGRKGLHDEEVLHLARARVGYIAAHHVVELWLAAGLQAIDDHRILRPALTQASGNTSHITMCYSVFTDIPTEATIF